MAESAMMERRGFLRAVLAAGMAPAIVKAGVLMPVREIWTPLESSPHVVLGAAPDRVYVFNGSTGIYESRLAVQATLEAVNAALIPTYRYSRKQNLWHISR